MVENIITTFVFDGWLNEYQRGFISGLMYLLTGKPSDTFTWGRKVDGDQVRWYKTLEINTERALAVRDEIEKLFPCVILGMI